jgi:hypothetical protein
MAKSEAVVRQKPLLQKIYNRNRSRKLIDVTGVPIADAQLILEALNARKVVEQLERWLRDPCAALSEIRAEDSSST